MQDLCGLLRQTSLHGDRSTNAATYSVHGRVSACMNERDNACNTQGLITISAPAISSMLCDQLRRLLCYLLSPFPPPLWHSEITCAPFLEQARSAALLARRMDALSAHMHDTGAGCKRDARTCLRHRAPQQTAQRRERCPPTAGSAPTTCCALGVIGTPGAQQQQPPSHGPDLADDGLGQSYGACRTVVGAQTHRAAASASARSLSAVERLKCR